MYVLDQGGSGVRWCNEHPFTLHHPSPVFWGAIIMISTHPWPGFGYMGFSRFRVSPLFWGGGNNACSLGCADSLLPRNESIRLLASPAAKNPLFLGCLLCRRSWELRDPGEVNHHRLFATALGPPPCHGGQVLRHWAIYKWREGCGSVRACKDLTGHANVKWEEEDFAYLHQFL